MGCGGVEVVCFLYSEGREAETLQNGETDNLVVNLMMVLTRPTPDAAGVKVIW